MEDRLLRKKKKNNHLKIMNSSHNTIAVDVMGGENSPYKTLKGVEIFLKKHVNTKIILLGDEKKIFDTINLNKLNLFNFDVINTVKNVLDDDSPSIILRNRKESSKAL